MKKSTGVYARPNSPFWWISYRDAAGKRVQISSRTKDYTEACVLLKRIKTRLVHRLPLPDIGEHTALRQSLLALLSEQERSRSKTNATIKSDRPRIERFCAFCEKRGLSIIESIDAHIVDEFGQSLLNAGLEPATVNRYVGCLTGLLPQKLKVRRYNSGRKIGKEIPDVIIAKILASVDPVFRAFLILLAETGLRTSHLCNAESSWLTEYKSAGKVRYFLNFPPAASSRMKNAPLVPLSDTAIAVIRNLPCRGKYLFEENKAPLFTKDRVTRRWQYHTAKLGISGYRVYDLRHTWAIREIMRTGDISYVSKVLGHSNPSTTLAYYQNLSTARIIERIQGAEIVKVTDEFLSELKRAATQSVTPKRQVK